MCWKMSQLSDQKCEWKHATHSPAFGRILALFLILFGGLLSCAFGNPKEPLRTTVLVSTYLGDEKNGTRRLSRTLGGDT